VELEKIERTIIRLKNEKEKHRPDLSIGVVFTVEEETQEDVDPFIGHWESIVDHVRMQPKLIQSPRDEPCPEPFGKDYGKLVVLWDGTVLPCCVDYNASLKLGNAFEDSVQDLWRGREIERLRAQHDKGEYPDVCTHCNECETSKTKKRFFFEAAVP
jgi:radical SAM protein with 4Fe4S-binding SPASM domain